ncbi:hypothetical protein B932_3278 [Gluconobacter oxydans H24]|nr:hypothetical protein B932_3278 [Gluconobacter oxydans H24]
MDDTPAPILANENEAAKERAADMYARFNEMLAGDWRKGSGFSTSGYGMSQGRKV